MPGVWEYADDTEHSKAVLTEALTDRDKCVMIDEHIFSHSNPPQHTDRRQC